MRKLILIFVLVVLSFTKTKAQNLVYDGSFEDTLHCPWSLNGYISYSLNYWQYSGNISGVALNSCNTDNWGIPQNNSGFEYSHSGNGYIGLICFGGVSQTPDLRKFAVGQLMQTLVAGKKYKVTMHVSLVDSFIYACNNISIYFSDTLPTYNFYDLYKVNFNMTHPIDVNFHQDLSSKVGWTKLDTTFIASGNERWLTIGNFLPDSLSDTTYVGGNVPQTQHAWDYSNYYIDDVSVELYDETGSPTNLPQREAFRLFPNPATSVVYIDGKQSFTGIIIFNAQGSLVEKISTKPTVNYQLSIANYKKGIYFIKVTTEFGMQCLKLVVQ